jgi:hypothetical protein
VGAADIQNVLATAITGDNYDNSAAAIYNEEIARHEALKGNKQPTEGYDFGQILWFGKNIKTAVIQTKAGEQKGVVTGAGRAGAGESLAEKIAKLPVGKVLDVSNMDINTGKGVRTVAAPKTAKSGKYGTARVPIISNDVDRYVRAIRLAYGPDGETAYAADIAVVRQALSGAGQPAVFAAATIAPVPVARVPSPARVPGATLAPVPVFTAGGAAVPRIASPTVRTMGGAGLPAIPALGALRQ